MTVDDLRPWIAKNKDALLTALLDGSYQPQPVRGVEIPKPGGGKRQLGIPTVVDRLVQQAILQVRAEPTIEGVHTCPGGLGVFEWSSPAFSSTMDMLFAPTVDWCGVFKKADELRYIPGQQYM